AGSFFIKLPCSCKVRAAGQIIIGSVYPCFKQWNQLQIEHYLPAIYSRNTELRNLQSTVLNIQRRDFDRYFVTNMTGLNELTQQIRDMNFTKPNVTAKVNVFTDFRPTLRRNHPIWTQIFTGIFGFLNDIWMYGLTGAVAFLFFKIYVADKKQKDESPKFIFASPTPTPEPPPIPSRSNSLDRRPSSRRSNSYHSAGKVSTGKQSAGKNSIRSILSMKNIPTTVKKVLSFGLYPNVENIPRSPTPYYKNTRDMDEDEIYMEHVSLNPCTTE